MNLVGRGRQGRERLARVVPDRRPASLLRRREPSAMTRRARALGGAHRARSRAHVEAQAWDGLWYRRAYFDDGTPLGSASGTQCRIDSIAQSWAVISGAGDRQRAETAMDSALEHLYLPDAQLDGAARTGFRFARSVARVHRGLSARSARERWPVFARSRVDVDRARGTESCTGDVRGARRAESCAPDRVCEWSGPVSARTVCHARGHLLAAAACRARRMELVHRRGGLVLPRGTRMGAGCADTRCDDRDQALPAAAVVRVLSCTTGRATAITGSCSRATTGRRCGPDQRDA